MSRDGVKRINLRVPVRASRDDLAIMLIRGAAPYHVQDDDREELSADGAEKAIKEVLYRQGADIEGWSDHMDDDEQGEWLEWARRQVDRAFPALAPRGSDG